MRRFAKWLATVTGASQDIQRETLKQAGDYMYDYHYWLGKSPECQTLLKYYSDVFKRGNTTLIGYQHEVLRSKIYGIEPMSEKDFELKQHGF